MSDQFLNNAVNAFMTIQVTIRKAQPMRVSKRASNATADAMQTGLAVPVNSSVGVLGSLTSDLKTVISKYNAIRTWLYSNTLPFSEAGEGEHQRGSRLVAVTDMPRVLTHLSVLKGNADDALNAFLPRYREYFDARDRLDLGLIDDVKMPSPEELASKFGVLVAPPEPLTVVDASKLNLPAGLASQIAQRHSARLEKQIAGAKSSAMAEARDLMQDIERRMDDPKARMTQAMIDNTNRVARLLEGITVGYDNDPSMLELIKLMREQVGTSVGEAKYQRERVGRVAGTVAKGLADIAKRDAKPVVQQSTVAVGGLFADLID